MTFRPVQPAIFIIFAALLFSSCKKETIQPMPTPTPVTTSVCTASFPVSQGWLGADGATSVEISNGKSLWIFGDSFIGTTSAQIARTGAPLIHNTIGISTCSGSGSAGMQYYWGSNSSNSSPTPFFVNATSGHWYWVADAANVSGSIYITLMDVSSTGGGGGFGFQVNGITLAKISNPMASPSSWSVTYNTLTTSPGFYPGAAMTLDSSGQYLLLYTLYDGGNSSLSPKPVVLTRIPVSGLATPSTSIQYLNSSGVWINGMPATLASAKQVMPAGQTEFTVRYHSSLGKWVAVMTNPPAFSNNAVTLTASAPEGPWSSPTSAYSFSEMSQSGVWCYASKDHIDFPSSSSSDLMMTYVCNDTSLASVISNLNIYFPKMVNITIH